LFADVRIKWMQYATELARISFENQKPVVRDTTRVLHPEVISKGRAFCWKLHRNLPRLLYAVALDRGIVAAL
jgi:hypothetical protein